MRLYLVNYVVKTGKSIFAAVVGVAVMVPLSAPIQAQTGRNSYNFLDIPVSARAFGLGGQGLAIVAPDVTLSDCNPALIGPELEMQVAFNYMLYMGTSNFAGVRYGMAAGERGAWAAGIRYLNYGKMTYYEPDGTAQGEFSPQDVSFEGTYSHDFTDRLRGGINMKFIYSNYEQYTAFAIAADIGLNYYDPDRDLSLSVVLRNMGGQVKRFDKEYNRLPFDVQLGYMQGLGTSPFSIAISAVHLTKWDLPYYAHSKDNPEQQQVLKSNFGSNLFRHLVFGLQYSPSDRFYVDLGYNYKTSTDMSVYSRNFLSGFSMGLGFSVRGFSAGVAYAMPHRSASSLMVNLSCSVGELLD